MCVYYIDVLTTHLIILHNLITFVYHYDNATNIYHRDFYRSSLHHITMTS